MNNIVVSVHLCHSSSALMTKLIIKSTFMVFSINFFYPARQDGGSCYRYFSQICTLFLFFKICLIWTHFLEIISFVFHIL